MPVACAAASVWQPTQPALLKILAPAVGLPLSLNAGVTGSAAACGSEPTTVAGVGLDDTFSPAAGGEEQHRA